MADDSFYTHVHEPLLFLWYSHQELLRPLPIHLLVNIRQEVVWPFVPFPSPREHPVPPWKETQEPKGYSKISFLTNEEQTSTSHSDHVTLIRASHTTYRSLKPVCVSDPYIASQLPSSTQFYPTMVKRTICVCPLSLAWAFAFIDYDQL